ncbi:MAG: hypothetical protein WD512_11360 [Candidatus Paceibacterota bacterium]
MPSLKSDELSYTHKECEIYKIFGKKIKLICHDAELRPYIFGELNLYPKTDEADLTVEIVEKKDISKSLTHFEQNSIVEIPTKLSYSYFIFDGEKLVHILFSLKKPINTLHEWIQKFRNMEFNHRQERVGQIIHEQVLVPSVFFDEYRVPIHSSAVQYNGQVILFGGHGGVGKTSLELELCFNNDATFIADDMSVVSNSGVYPNLNFPKLYGYNVEGNLEIKERVISKRNKIDWLQWNYQKMKGADKVRRRISPAELYKNYHMDEQPIDRYVILKRCDNNEVQISKLSVNEATEVTIGILQSEFRSIFKVFGTECKNVILNRWEEKLPQIFSRINCEEVSIPEKMSHKKFKETMIELFINRI